MRGHSLQRRVFFEVMTAFDLKKIVLSAAFVVPLKSADSWQNLSFSKIPSNQVEFSDSGIKVEVKKSASPLIYPLNQPKSIKGLKVKGKVSHLIAFKDPLKQGEKGLDDCVLRIGLVIPGDKKLNWATRMVAADWVKKLYSLAPKGSGIDHIYFLNLVQSEELKGKERTHPLSELIKEKNEWVIQGAGEFELSADFLKAKNVAALWISIDGDDTGSQYQVDLSNIELSLAAEN